VTAKGKEWTDVDRHRQADEREARGCCGMCGRRHEVCDCIRGTREDGSRWRTRRDVWESLSQETRERIADA
jgi:hypothetical protein